jgi:hypothetical protein
MTFDLERLHTWVFPIAGLMVIRMLAELFSSNLHIPLVLICAGLISTSKFLKKDLWPAIYFLMISSIAGLTYVVSEHSILFFVSFLMIAVVACIFRKAIFVSEGIVIRHPLHIIAFVAIVFALAIVPRTMLGPR